MRFFDQLWAWQQGVFHEKVEKNHLRAQIKGRQNTVKLIQRIADWLCRSTWIKIYWLTPSHMLYKITPLHILYKLIHREIFIFLNIIKNLFTSSFFCFSLKYLFIDVSSLLDACLIFLGFSAARSLPRSLSGGARAWACSEC